MVQRKASDIGKKPVKSKTTVLITKSAVFVLTILSVVLLTNSSAYPMASSYILEVPYHDQLTSYNCGPAAVQMVLEYSIGVYLPQDLLSEELDTDSMEGVTYTYSMNEPFQSRMITKVKSGRTSLNQLKQRINQGYAPILLIWFDQNYETGHYVVAVGYNETGVFINDPWPEEWEQPLNRETGSHVYLSNSELRDLWSSYYQWSLTVPFTQPEDKSFKVDVILNGVPENAKTVLSLNGAPVETLNGDDKTTLFLIDEPDYHSLRVEIIIQGEDGVQYICTDPSISVSESSVIEFNYIPIR